MANEDKFSRYTIRPPRLSWKEGDDDTNQNHFLPIGDLAQSVLFRTLVQLSNPQFAPPTDVDSVEKAVENIDDECE